MIVWIVVLLLIAAVLLMPVGIRVRYDQAELSAQAVIGPVSLPVYPAKKKKPKKTKKTAARSTDTDVKIAVKKKEPLTQYFPLLSLVMDFARAFGVKLRVDLLQLHWLVAGGDPADIALQYGKACASVGALLPALEGFLNIKTRDIQVRCSFEEEKSSICGRLHLSLTVGAVLSLLGFYGVKLIFGYMKILNNKKGGAKA